MKTLQKHLVSLAWRLSVMALAVFINLVVFLEFGVFLMPIPLFIVGTIAGEFTKWLNTSLKGKKVVEFEVKKTKTIAKKKKK